MVDTAIKETINLNLPDVLRDLLLILGKNEKEVITKRFALSGGHSKTLEEIGRGITPNPLTRERIRQIQAKSLDTLHRGLKGSALKKVAALIRKKTEESGGIIREEKIVAEVLNEIKDPSKLDGQIIRLLLSIDKEIKKRDKSDRYFCFWHLSHIKVSDIIRDTDSIISILNKKKNPMSIETISRKLTPVSALGKSVENLPQVIREILEIDKRFKETEDGLWGLRKWRHVNPRSICDKIYIVLKKEKKPMHFVDIANLISKENFDKQNVTVQAVHNELIRFEPFVLIGRGLYALKEWGYAEGTVADIIEDILKKSRKPVSKQDIVNEVLNQRKVRISTISLNLQKHNHFVRVGRALYKLDMSKKETTDSRRGHRNVEGKKKKALPTYEI